MPQVSLDEWNRYLAGHPQAHLLQSGEWGELKFAFGWSPVRLVNGAAGAQILFRKLPLGFTVGYIPKGPILDDGPRTTDRDGSSSMVHRLWQEIDLVCRQHRAVFLKVELDEWEDKAWTHVPLPGFIPSSSNIQPRRTLVVDLEGSPDDLLGRMKQKCRYNIRLAEKKGVSVRAWDDLAAFHNMILATGGRDGFGVHSRDYYRRAYDLFHPTGKCELLVAEFEGRALAALMVFVSGGRAWYLYGASSDDERSRMPTYLLQWEAMRWAQAHGAREYDLWGVPDEDETALEARFESRGDGLWGVYRFKRGFGGGLKRSVQAQDRVFNAFLYRIYLLRIGNQEAA